MHLKIHGSTTSDQDGSLCTSCRWATIIRGLRLADEIIACGKLTDHDRITFVVSSCTEYSNRATASLFHMEDIAWILRSDSKRKTVGFVRARDLKFSVRHVLDDED